MIYALTSTLYELGKILEDLEANMTCVYTAGVWTARVSRGPEAFQGQDEILGMALVKAITPAEKAWRPTLL